MIGKRREVEIRDERVGKDGRSGKTIGMNQRGKEVRSGMRRKVSA